MSRAKISPALKSLKSRLPSRQPDLPSFSVRGRTIDLARIDTSTWLLGGVLLVVLLVIALGGDDSASGETEETKVEATKGVVELTSTGSGSIESARASNLNFGTSGDVVAVYVKEGDHVKKGQKIARLDRSEAELAVEEAENNLEAAENGESTTSTSTTGVSYSGSQDAGMSTAVYYGGATDGTISIMADDGTILDTTGTTGPTGETGETGATGSTGSTGATGPVGPSGGSGGSGGGSTGGSGESGGESGTTPEGNSGDSSGSMSGGGGSGGGTSSSAGGSSSGSTSSENSETAIKSARLDLRSAREALRETVLRAPYSGTIVSLDGAVGDSVSGDSGSSDSTSSSDSTGQDSSTGASGSTSGSSSSAFAVIQQLDALEMSVDVSEADINEIQVGQRATVSIESADDEQLAARVSNVGLLASTDSSDVVTYPVTVRITQTSDAVRPGMSAEVSIVVDQASGVVTVPNQALTGNSVQVVGSGGDTETKTVETGLVGDSTTEITSGLDAGDTVVIPQTTISTSSDSASSDSESSGLGSAMSGGMPSGGPPSGGGVPGGG